MALHDLGARARTQGPAGRLVGRSPSMQSLYEQIETVAETDATVLIEGETGTGKSLVARTIHDLSLRSGRSYVTLAATNLQEPLFESELFGHVRGSFSGAHQDHEGLARAADGGTLFVDEVGELSASNQARLLHFLDDKEVRPVGSTRTRSVDVRIVAATNRDLRREVRKGAFRQDLYYRLRVIHLRVPPLRDRLDDVPLLVAHFLERFCRRHGKRIEGFDDEASSLLRRSRWKGNVRELENEIERAVIMTADGGTVHADVLSDEIHGGIMPEPEEGTGLRAYRRRAERRLILATLRRKSWNVSATARELGLSRVGLTKKLKRLGIERPG